MSWSADTSTLLRAFRGRSGALAETAILILCCLYFAGPELAARAAGNMPGRRSRFQVFRCGEGEIALSRDPIQRQDEIACRLFELAGVTVRFRRSYSTARPLAGIFFSGCR